MSTGFTDELHARNADSWQRAVTHRFVDELAAGTIDPRVMAGYLIQDYRFLDSFLVLLGSAVAAADTLDGRLRLARFIGEIAGDENTYFLRAFEALGVTAADREQIPDTEPTRQFTALFREAAATGEYAAILAVLLVAESLYLDWASSIRHPLPESFVHSEWIELHNTPGFHELVSFLRAELDRVGPTHADLAHAFFQRAVALELAFFDASYAEPPAELGR